MRLIDAHYLMERMYDANPKGRVELAELIKTEPTVDAVEVVRCKDCVYCKRYNDVWYLPKKDELLCTLHVDTYHTDENDYCSWGERRKDGKTDLRKGIDEAD